MCSKRSLKCSSTGALQIRQFPRFIGVGTQSHVRIHCSSSPGLVQWYKLNKYNEDRNTAEEVKERGRFKVPSPGTKLYISDLHVEDKGVYFCKVNDTWGPGTQLQVSSKGPAQRASSLRSGHVATNVHSSSPRICQPNERSVQDQHEGRSHHLPGSAAGDEHRRPDATQAQTGEDRGHRVVVGQDICYGQVSFRTKNSNKHFYLRPTFPPIHE